MPGEAKNVENDDNDTRLFQPRYRVEYKISLFMQTNMESRICLFT